jgi:hypothetical protein
MKKIVKQYRAFALGCHSRESGNLIQDEREKIPAFAGMTYGII